MNVEGTPRVRLDAKGCIAEDLACSRCGYNLRGEKASGLCPECGHTVHRSIYAAELAEERAAKWHMTRSQRKQRIELFVALFYMPGFMAGMILSLLLKSAWGFAIGFAFSLTLAIAAVKWKQRRDRLQGFSLHLDREQRIANDLPCSRCRYNLHGLREKDECPECGLSIHRSIYAAELAATPMPTMKRWLATRIYIAAIGAGIPTFFLCAVSPTAGIVGFAAVFGGLFALTYLIKEAPR